MYTLQTMLAWMGFSLLLGIVLTLAMLLIVFKAEEPYHEKDDTPIDADWVDYNKTLEEIKHGR